MSRIDHTSHTHPATPAARRACRTALAKSAVVVEAAPFAKRAIVVNFVLKDGTACRVVFDRYGRNSELFNTALAYRWSAERTMAQAASEAINGVLKAYGEGSIARHTIHETD